MLPDCRRPGAGRLVRLGGEADGGARRGGRPGGHGGVGDGRVDGPVRLDDPAWPQHGVDGRGQARWTMDNV